MFDRVVLCTEGNSLHAALRAKNLELANNDLVKVYLINESTLNSSFNMAGVTASMMSGVPQLTSVFSMQTELHVAAYGSASNSSVGGYYAVVVVSGKALICARSDERLIANEKLAMTFDVEETNGVLKATADFDGNITQGLLKMLVGAGEVSIKKHTDDDSAVGTFTVNDSSDTEIDLALGSAADADVLEGSALECFSDGELVSDEDKLVTLEQADDVAKMRAEEVADSIGDGELTISAGNNTVTFSANSDSDASLTLGEAANRDVDSSITSGTTSNGLPTSSAVDAFVGKANLSITVHPNGAALNTTFSANASSNVNINLGLGDAADKDVDAAVSENSNDLPTSAAVATYVSDQLSDPDNVGNGTITVYPGSTNNASLGSFTVNQKTNYNLVLGEAAGKAVDTTIPASNASSNLPTSAAVASYVGTANLTIKKHTSDNSPVGTFSANAQSDVAVDLALGTAADKDALLDNNLTDVANHGDDLTSLSQVKTLVDQATAVNALAPADAAAQEITPAVGQMMWLAINFSGQVGIVDFTTAAVQSSTPSWNGTTTSATDAYIAEIVDNAGDFRATQNRIIAGCTFRTLNAMDSTGMTSPAYGFALCVCTAVPNA